MTDVTHELEVAVCVELDALMADGMMTCGLYALTPAGRAYTEARWPTACRETDHA